MVENALHLECGDLSANAASTSNYDVEQII